MKKPKRIVLGEGHPWFFSTDKGPFNAVELTILPVAQSILLRGGEKTVAINYSNLGNWNRIRLIAEVLE